MTTFSTEFPIDSRNSVEDVLRLACDWICGSPHTELVPSSFTTLPVNEEFRVTGAFEVATVASVKLDASEMGGLLYSRSEGGLEWTTSIVTLKHANSHLLSLQVTCQAMTTAVRLPPPKKPYFIRQAIERLGGGFDGQVPVADRPFRLSEGEEAVAAALISGTAGNRLPIVFVSAASEGDYLVDPDELARFVSGMAHVVVEPSRRFSLRLKDLAGARNVFSGTVGVYWPESAARKSYFAEAGDATSRELQIAIAKDIRVALSNRRVRSNCTWTFLQEHLARKRVEQIAAGGSAQLSDYISAFDAEITAKETRLAEAEQEISRLTAEVKRLSLGYKAVGGLLTTLQEQDLYEDEIRDIAIEALQDAHRVSREGSRREHVLADLIKANAPTGRRQQLRDEVKGLLKAYREMDPRTKSGMQRLGFEISEDGKHIKAVFQGDGRYTFVLPKSSSDVRAGKNLVSDLNGLLF